MCSYNLEPSLTVASWGTHILKTLRKHPPFAGRSPSSGNLKDTTPDTKYNTNIGMQFHLALFPSCNPTHSYYYPRTLSPVISDVCTVALPSATSFSEASLAWETLSPFPLLPVCSKQVECVCVYVCALTWVCACVCDQLVSEQRRL
jgi:hypothetical protein